MPSGVSSFPVLAVFPVETVLSRVNMADVFP